MAEPLQILLCEDNYPDRLYLKMQLDKTNLAYNMQTCEDGAQALRFLEEASEGRQRLPDLLMLEIKLPKYSGLELLEKVRDLPTLKKLPVAILSGSDDTAELNRASSLGAFFLKKPADFEKLCQLMAVVEQSSFATAAAQTSGRGSIGHTWGTQAHLPPEGKNAEYRLLLVEEDPREVRYVQDLLKNSAEPALFALEPVQDFADAISRLAHRHYDVIALALDLPDSSALDAYTHLQQFAPDVPVVIVTGDGDSELVKEAMTLGAQDYVVKSSEDYGQVLLRSLKYAIHRKRAESLAKDALIREHSILQEALAKAPIYVMRVDQEVRLIDANAAAVTAFGLDRNAVLGQNLLDLMPDLSSADLKDLVRSGQPFQVSNLCMRKTGAVPRHETYWDILAWPVYSHQGTVQEAIVMANDVTEKIKIAQQRDEFVQTLAHDIKNPILGEQRLLRALLDRFKGRIEPRDVGLGLHELFKSNEALAHMLINLLEAYKFEGNLYKPFARPIDIGSVVSECVAELKTQLVMAGIDVTTEIQPDVPAIQGDRIAIKRLILNILHNSIKYTPAAGEIKITASLAGEMLAIAISDTGPGLGPEEQAALFQRFAPDEKGKRKLNSSGLGLFICKRIAEAHNGSIACASEPGRGATFTVTFPLNLAQ